MPMAEFTLDSVIRGHHFYKTIWRPREGETLQIIKERANDHDRYAVSVLKDETDHVG